jgi:lysophospholipase L1-like esterase
MNSMLAHKLLYKIPLGLIILVLSGLSAWRLLAILGLNSLGWGFRWGFGGLFAFGFLLFWLAVLRAVRFFKRTLVAQQWLALVIGTIVFGLVALLGATPAGLSRIRLELQAENVWSPRIFSAIWSDPADRAGVEWHTRFKLPEGRAEPATLEIIATGQPTASDSSEVWLVSAAWPDGTTIPPDAFQADAGWQLQEVNWGAYENKAVWVSRQNQPATLRWTGRANGLLTLAFASHNQGGEVTVRWNGSAQTLDLYTPDVEFQGITLPAGEPAVWQADLPVSALAGEISLVVEPDPGGDFPAILQTLHLSGVAAQPVTAAGDQLIKALQFDSGSAVPVETGLQFTTRKADEVPRATLTGPLAPRWRWAGFIPPLENGLLVLYGGVIGGLVVGSLAGRVRSPMLANANLVAISLLVAVGLGEAVLRAYLPPADKYYVWPPHLHAIFNPDPKILTGIEGESHFIINSQGIRGDEFSPADDYRILAIGGSTTESLYVDQTEAWPQLVQAKLNEAQTERRVWVGNAGKSGFNTREHILQMRYLLPQYPSVDAVILLIGGNDFNLRLIEGDSYKPNYMDLPGAQQALLKRVFKVLPQRDPALPYYQRSAVWRLANQIEEAQGQAQTVDAIDTEDNRGKVYLSRRERRKNGRRENNLPDLSPGLAEYARNVNTLIDMAQAHNVRLILMTQPTLWRADLTQAEEDLLWLGWQPGHEVFYTAEALRQGMAIYNDQLLEICQQRQIECIDLASALPKDTTAFYDGVHFNEGGSRQVATVVADYLLRHEPFVFGK